MKKTLGRFRIFGAAFFAAILACAVMLPADTAFAADEIIDDTIAFVNEQEVTDASQIQAVLNINADSSSGQLVVKIPKGEYLLNATLYVYPHTTIQADPEAVFIKQSAYGAMVEAKLTNDCGGYESNQDITIQGGVWDSSPIMNNAVGTETFRFIHCSDIEIKDAVLRNVPEGSHLIVFAGVKNATVTNCKFYGYGDDGNTEKTQKEAIQLDITHNNELVPTNQTVVWDDLPCDGITVSDCEFYDFSRGIGSHTAVAGKLHSNITISNNKFYDLQEAAIKLFNYRNTVIENNTITNTKLGILVYTALDTDEKAYFQPNNKKVDALPSDYQIQINNNTITSTSLYDSRDWGDGIRVIGSSSLPMSGVVISGNTISTAQRYGIFATTAPRIQLSGNQISATTQHGILLEKGCDNASVVSNTVANAKDAGIALYSSSGIEADLNTVTNPSKYGIYLIDTENTIVGTSSSRGNKIDGAKIKGIYLTSGSNNNKVMFNTITNCGGDGIIGVSSNNVMYYKNTISTSGNGIYVTTGSKQSNITTNTIVSAGKHGIWVSTSCTQVRIYKNTVKKYAASGNGYYGIYLYKAGGTASAISQVTNNQISGSGSSTKNDGIKISTSPYTTITGNTIQNPAGCGIYLIESANCLVGTGSTSYNVINSSKSKGIYLTYTSKGCPNTKLLYNRITNSAGDGIGANKCSNVMYYKNTVSAKGNGIYITNGSTKNNITTNTVVSAGKNGIWASTNCTQARIYSNTVKKYATSGDTNYGIFVYKAGGTNSSNTSSVYKNNVTGYGKYKSHDGICLNASPYTTVGYNTVTNAAGSGISVYKSANCNVYRNTIKTPIHKGIFISTSSTGTKVTINTIYKAGDISLEVYKSGKATVSSNQITANRKRGIWVHYADDSKVTSNTVKYAKNKEAVMITNSKKCTNSKNKITY